MVAHYNGVETLHFEPEDFYEVNILNLNSDWLRDLKKAYNYDEDTAVDLRLFVLIDHLEKMATSDGIWFVNLNEPVNRTTPNEGEDDMVGC